MRLLLVGEVGQLGWELRRCLAPLGELLAVDIPRFDLQNTAHIQALMRAVRPQVVVNAAAYTAVDRAEDEPEAALAINGTGPGFLAQEAEALGALLIHYSTDYVFDGTKGSPYLEEDRPNPLNVYGETKLAGEAAIQETGCAHLILRTSWVYSLRGSSFVTKVLGWAEQNPILRVVDDQISNPTWCRMLAEITGLLLAEARQDPAGWLDGRQGVYHLAGWGKASRLDWAKAILKYDPHPETRQAKDVLPAKTADFPTPAGRPLYSALDCTRFADTFGLRLPPWEEALQLAMAG